MTVRSKLGSSSGGVATSNLPFVGDDPGSTPTVCPLAARRHAPRGRSCNAIRNTSNRRLHVYARCCIVMRLCFGSGSSVRRASRAPSCCASPPSIRSSRSPCATADSQAGVAAATSIRASPAPTRGSCSRRSTPIRSTGSTSCSSACRTRRRWRLAPQLVGRVGCVVDLSAAYRLKDAAQYPAYYGFEHDQPELLAEAVYGLPELHRDELKGARLIATPGCYVTAATLALRPLVESGVIETKGVIVDAASGVTGAGRKTDHAYSFTTVDENFTAYGLLDASPHARDGAGDRRPAAVHAAPGADEPRHPRHLLRPPGERRPHDRRLARAAPRAVARRAVHGRHRRLARRRRRRSARTPCT